MKTHSFIFLAIAFILSGQAALAQTAEKTYYRIMSAKPAYSGYCIEDNTSNNNGSNDFLIKTWNLSNQRQEWELVPNADSTAYYIRNRYSLRYIGPNITYVASKYFYTQNASVQSSSCAWIITDVGYSQKLLSSTDSYGATRFLNATNTTETPEKIYLTGAAVNSGFAWYLIDATIDPTGVNDKLMDNDIKVSTLNGHIIVAGTNDYTIYDVSGRKIPSEQSLECGAYIVTTKTKSFKILIK